MIHVKRWLKIPFLFILSLSNNQIIFSVFKLTRIVLFSGPKNIQVHVFCRKITRTRELQLHVCNSILNLCNLKLFLFFFLVYSAWILFTSNVFIILNISNEVALVPTETGYHDVGHGIQCFYSHSKGKTSECKGWVVVKSNILWWRRFTILYYTTLQYTTYTTLC